MEFEWNEDKSQRNRTKHGISFETATLVFNDPNHLSIQDRFEDGEERWQTLGQVNNLVIILVAHTVRIENSDEIIRIISARKATRAERQYYEKTI